jgi:hypothetical protein
LLNTPLSCILITSCLSFLSIPSQSPLGRLGLPSPNFLQPFSFLRPPIFYLSTTSQQPMLRNPVLP